MNSQSFRLLTTVHATTFDVAHVFCEAAHVLSREATPASSLGRQPKVAGDDDRTEPRSGNRFPRSSAVAASRLTRASAASLGLTPEAIRCRRFATEETSHICNSPEANITNQSRRKARLIESRQTLTHLKSFSNGVRQ